MSAETALNLSPTVCKRAQAIVRALKAADMSIVTAESCTAGMIAAALSRADGASEVLHGGFVTYTKAHKTAALGVSADLLREHGAVKELVVGVFKALVDSLQNGQDHDESTNLLGDQSSPKPGAHCCVVRRPCVGTTAVCGN
jgi:hypothetical protein